MRVSITDGGWLLGVPVGRPKLRLFCFAYAGGNAAEFLDWQASLGADIELRGVQLPGRGARWAEAPLETLDPLVETIAGIVRANAALPFAFFGHSFGALLAYEVARHCRDRGWPMPCHLFASACDAPQRFVPQAWRSIDDAELLDILRRLDGTAAALIEHDELMEMMLPMFRADFGLVAGYAHREAAPLDLPITVLAGDADPHVDPTTLLDWGALTHAGCEVRTLPGGHFFQRDRAADVIALVRDTLVAHAVAEA